MTAGYKRTSVCAHGWGHDREALSLGFGRYGLPPHAHYRGMHIVGTWTYEEDGAVCVYFEGDDGSRVTVTVDPPTARELGIAVAGGAG